MVTKYRHTSISQRIFCGDVLLIKFGLVTISAYSAFFFALPIETFSELPLVYEHISRIITELQLAVLFAVISFLSALSIYLYDVRGKNTIRFSTFIFGIQGPLWTFMSLSIVWNQPASYVPWWLFFAAILAEFVAIQPWLARRHGCGVNNNVNTE
jgi:hypothetical protein